MDAKPFWVVMALIIGFFSAPVLAKSDLPHEFEEAVPLYPSAQPVGTGYTRDSVTVQFATQDSYDRVSRFYVQVLAETGWRIQPERTTGEIRAKLMESASGDIHLTIMEASALPGHHSGFVIDLYYPGGRE